MEPIVPELRRPERRELIRLGRRSEIDVKRFRNSATEERSGDRVFRAA